MATLAMATAVLGMSEEELLMNAKHIIQLTDLPESTAHADVTEAVRGGMPLNSVLGPTIRSRSKYKGCKIEWRR